VTALALPGQQTNLATVTAQDANPPGTTVTDNNPANYFGGITATWSQSPASGDYTNGSNWSTGTQPVAFDTAEFEASKITTVSIGPASVKVGEWLFSPGAVQYNIEIPLSSDVLFDGSGIVINAGSVHIFNFGEISLGGGSSPGTALIDNFGVVDFGSFSSTGAATIHTYSGASVQFHGPSPGGSAQFITDAGGTVDLSANGLRHVTAGSIAGAGTYALGSNQLMVGLNGLSTEVSGLIEDGGGHGGTGASLFKVGPGTLKLSHAGNTYTAGTLLGAGKLDVAAPGAVGTGAITFANAGKTKAILEIDNAALSAHHFANLIDNFGKHDFLDLPRLHFHAGATATYHKANHHLTVHSGRITDALMLLSPHGTKFTVTNDGHGGSKVTLDPPHIAATTASVYTHDVIGQDWANQIDGSANHPGDFLFVA
jgi:autotransporter-associated beta strand protein